jgi:nucleoside-diphosphate-sugar epimerase
MSAGFKVDCFSRGKEERKGDKVTGDVFTMASSDLIDSQYDVVINCILIKEHTVEENLRYIKELINLCHKKNVKRLIHVSSIMVYNINESLVNEETGIENSANKAGYGALKIEIDKYLQSLYNLHFKLTLIRLGYVLTEDRSLPFVIKLPFGFALIKGSKESRQPVLQRTDMHRALLNMITLNSEEPVYLFVPSHNNTKYVYARDKFNYRFIFFPKHVVLCLAHICALMKFVDKSFYTRIEGMFSETKYDPSKTEKLLKVKF